MEILKLKLFSIHLENQFDFYVNHLNFTLKEKGTDCFTIIAGKTELVFERSSRNHSTYHFAFLIPNQQIDDAVKLLTSKGIEVLPFEGKDTVDFGNGRSVYFHDSDGNIVEFIQRPSLDFSSDSPFSISQIIKVNEIGLPVENTLEISRQLIDQHAIDLINPDKLNEQFCWVGDFNGAFIVTKIGRNWLPTSIPGEVNDFCIGFMTRAGDIHSICITDNNVSNWNPSP